MVPPSGQAGHGAYHRPAKRHGITDICVTLQYMPEVVQSWFGDGAELGVRLTYFVEREPLGYGGQAKTACPTWGRRLPGDQRDAVCDLDLSAAIVAFTGQPCRRHTGPLPPPGAAGIRPGPY
ncbi:MAG: hypothetical protein ACLSAF_12045 [Intestinimonas sp.]